MALGKRIYNKHPEWFNTIEIPAERLKVLE